MQAIAATAGAWGLSSALVWGVSDYWNAKAAREVGPVTAAFFVNTIGAVAFAAFYAAVRPHAPWDAAGVGYGVASGAALAVGQVLFFRGLSIGPVSLVVPLSATYPLAAAAIVAIVFNEPVTGRDVAGIVLVVAGVMAASGLLGARRAGGRIGRGPALALATALAWGAGFSCFSQAAIRAGWQATILMQSAATAVALWFLLPLVSRGEHVFGNTRAALLSRPVLGAGIFQQCGLVALSVGIAHSPHSAAIVTAISSCYPALTVVLALRRFKEEVALIPLTGAAVTVAGVVVLSLG